MNIEISTNVTELSKGDTALYSVSLIPTSFVSSAKIEVILSAEKFPDMDVIPDIGSITVSNDLTYTADISETGILEINFPQINSSEGFSTTFSADAINSLDKNTTAVIVTSDNNGSISEAYAQITLDGNPPSELPYACFLIIVCTVIVLYLFKKII